MVVKSLMIHRTYSGAAAAFLMIFLGACSSITPPSNVYLTTLGEYYWDSESLASLSYEKKNLELTKAKASCTVQKLSVPIPSPTCVQPPKSDCSGLEGFAKGFCQSYTPQPRCDYGAVNAAKQAQEEIWSACMIAEGWTLSFSSEGFGSDPSGGLYSPPIANDGTNVWYVKLDSINISDSLASALVRAECMPDIQCVRSQNLWLIDFKNRTLIVNQEESLVFTETSPAKWVADFLRSYSPN